MAGRTHARNFHGRDEVGAFAGNEGNLRQVPRLLGNRMRARCFTAARATGRHGGGFGLGGEMAEFQVGGGGWRTRAAANLADRNPRRVRARTTGTLIGGRHGGVKSPLPIEPAATEMERVFAPDRPGPRQRFMVWE